MDKIDRLFDAVEHPDLYSEKDLEDMLRDPETREIYDLMSKSKEAFAQIGDIDVDAEWDSFDRNHFRAKPRFLTFFNRHAAAVIIGVAATLAAVASGIGISFSLDNESRDESNIVESDRTAEAADCGSPNEPELEIEQSAPEVIIYKEETLYKILQDISGYYKTPVKFSSEDAKTLRLRLKWDQNKPLDEVVETLNNFEQITITLSDDTITVE